jgi:hypothetical protein
MKNYVIRVDGGLKEIVFEGTPEDCLKKWAELEKARCNSTDIKERTKIFIVRDEQTYEKNKGGIL